MNQLLLLTILCAICASLLSMLSMQLQESWMASERAVAIENIHGQTRVEQRENADEPPGTLASPSSQELGGHGRDFCASRSNVDIINDTDRRRSSNGVDGAACDVSGADSAAPLTNMKKVINIMVIGTKSPMKSDVGVNHL